ncbi:TPA: type I DNA topoisomerase [Candidatus Poribacteria bacterium]|nr:type I DNA topoisomerase [Candidatus Poribacteria bacterium]
MSKSLVVVESPAKVKTISKFLGKDYTVKASMGHIRDLPETGLSVDIENGFKPHYTIIEGKKKIVNEIKKAADNVDDILIATDPDREGEAICWHLAHELKKSDKPIKRITFNEITKNAVLNAIKHPGQIDQNLVDAQQARRILDRLVGYQISPILGKTIKWGLSAGRVQSVAVRLICEREDEILAFVPEEYWTIDAILKGENTNQFSARLFEINGKKAKIDNEEQAKSILKDLDGEDYTIDKIDRKERKKNPVPPFTTSKLQQEAVRKLRMPVKTTMRVAQDLYEGVELGDEGSVGLITYMRTDSTRVAKEAIDSVRDFIGRNFGDDYLPDKAVHYQSKKGAQDAHEAIRPTDVNKTPSEIKKFLTQDQYELYDLIWKRFVASQMKPAIYDVTTIDIKAGKYTFRANGSIIKFKGFMSVYMESVDEETEEEKESILPELTVGQKLLLLNLIPEQHFTQPPPRYNEATLVKALEEKGIGRPSTYATIISTIQDREYVTKEQGRFVPTEMGRLVNNALLKSFPEIIDVEFTAKMESELDNIEEGKVNWVKVLEEFYKPFSKSLEKAPDNIKSAKKDMEETTDEICDICGRKMVIKWGRYGRFLACSGFPECKGTKQLNNKESVSNEPEATDEICEKCGSPMVIRTSKYGKFLSCSQYPKCKFTKPLSIGIKCPRSNCDGYLVERRSKYGKIFYGCSKYPECDLALWNKPVNKPCPKCKATFLVEKTSKVKGNYLACITEGCGYTEGKE